MRILLAAAFAASFTFTQALPAHTHDSSCGETSVHTHSFKISCGSDCHAHVDVDEHESLGLAPTLSLSMASQTLTEERTVAKQRPPLPLEVHPSFMEALAKADRVSEKQDFQQALALIAGVLYPDGVTVSIDAASLGGMRALGVKAAERGIATWNQSLGQDNPVRYVGIGKPAEIVIKFTDKVPEGSADALGLIELRKEYRWNRTRFEVSNTGVIHVQRHFEGEALGDAHLAEIVCHELGHLIGLADVEYVGHLMGPMDLNRPASGPQPHEVRAVRVLRDRARTQWNDVRDLILKSKPNGAAQQSR